MTLKQSAITWSALLCVVVLLIYPLISEDTQSSCHATEKFAIRQIVKHAPKTPQSAGEQLFASGILSALSTGDIAAAYIKDRYPPVPASVGCWFMWWKILLDPTEIKTLARELNMGK